MNVLSTPPPRSVSRLAPKIVVCLLMAAVAAGSLLMATDPSRRIPASELFGNICMTLLWLGLWGLVQSRRRIFVIAWVVVDVTLYTLAGGWTLWMDMATVIALVGLGYHLTAGILVASFAAIQAWIMPLVHEGVKNPLGQAAYSIVIFGVAYGAGFAVYVGLRNAAEVARLHRELAASAEREKELALQADRERSARDLHDGLGQQLTVLCMSLDYALTRRQQASEEAWSEVRHARDIASEALADMRVWVRASNPARPPAPKSARDWSSVAQSFAGTGLSVDIVTNDVDELPADIHDYVHRLLQEGLTNAVKHGAARHAQLTFRRENGDLVIELFNDGSVPHASALPGFGWRSLAGRAQNLGGTFETQLEPGHGCTLRTRLPERQLEHV